jgi:hypothetical protein
LEKEYREYYFVDDDRTLLEGAQIDDLVGITLRGPQEEIVPVVFRVTRKERLGDTHVIYGAFIDEDGFLRQIEFRFNEDKEGPQENTIRAYYQAPFIYFKLC